MPEATSSSAAFIDAIKAGEFERVKAMVSAEPTLIDARSRTGDSAILTAVYHRQKEIVNLLVARGAAMTRLLASDERGLALRCLLAGGDDYELCFTVPRAREPDVERIARELGLALTRIGNITQTSGLAVDDESGRDMAALPRGFDHFAV